MSRQRFILSLLLVMLLLIVTSATAMADGPTIKYVDQQNGDDSNDGNTEATAYVTLQKAIDESESGLSDSDRSIIYVKDGVYGIGTRTGCEGLPATIAINNLDYLTIQALPGHNPVVRPDTAVEANITSISIDDSDHLIVDNIDSDQTIAQFDNWHVCNSDDLIVRNSQFEGGEDGIDFGTSFTGALIENNHFVDIDTGNGDEVLDFTDGAYADVMIQDNLFENNYRQITISPVGSATNFVIRRNVMNGTTSQEAVRLIGPDNVTLENNVIMNSTQQGLYIDGGTSNVNVWHNTFFNNGEEEIRTKEAGADIVITDNILYANGASAAISADVNPLPGEDYNLIFNNGADTESSLPAVTSFSAHTLTGQDPLFVSTTAGAEDLHLQPGSPALEAGLDVGVSDDLERNPRPNPAGTDPDMGAYEAHFDDEGPITTNVVGDPNPIAVNANGTVSANVDDTTTGGSTIASAEYSLDSGTTWTPMNADDGAFDQVSEDVNASFTAPSEAGIYDLCVRGTDDPGNVGAAECAMLVVYDPDGGFVTGGGWIDSPAGAMSIPARVWDQGFETNADGWLDTDDAWYGTVTRIASGTNGISSASGAFHAMMEGDADSGPFSRFDGYRDTWTGTWMAEIDIYLDPAWVAGTGFDYSVAASGTDGNHQRDFIFHVTKDTSTGALLVAGSNNTNFAPREDLENINHYEVTGAGWYTLQHVFRNESGALAVDLNLLDANGNVLFTETRFNAADTIPAEVGGNRYAWFTFINVSGGIAVDEHQLTVSASPTGKANFGFVSKYKKGASVPTGNTEFVFKAGDLNFHSSSYEWLVVTGNNTAKFKGEGTINGDNAPGGDPYKFQIWAQDDNPDTFRIKIWVEDGGNETVVYDNGMDQEIGGGNIVVHNK